MGTEGAVSAARPQLRLVDTATGELQEDAYAYQLDELQKKYLGLLGENGRLKKQLAELRLVEPEAVVIRDVLEYWRDLCAPNAVIAPGGKRWEKVRARLSDKLTDRDPWTPEELKLAVDGALLDPWLSGRDRKSPGYLNKAETIFRDPEQIEKLRDLALGFEAKANVSLRGLTEVADRLSVVNWKHALRPCECSHVRIEHSLPDPAREGREGCFFCGCEDYFADPFDWVAQR